MSQQDEFIRFTQEERAVLKYLVDAELNRVHGKLHGMVCEEIERQGGDPKWLKNHYENRIDILEGLIKSL
jgi:hypothetical protein